MGLTEQEASLQLDRIEKDHQLYRYSVDGWSVWYALRSLVFRSLQDLPLSNPNPFLEWRWKDKLSVSFQEIPTILKPPECETAVFSPSSFRSEKVGDCYKDVFFDDILPELEPFYKIEILNNKSFYEKNSRRALIPSNQTNATFNLLVGLFSRLFQTSEIRQFAAFFSKFIQREIELNFSENYLAKLISQTYWHKKVYAGFFRRLQPKRILIHNPGQISIIAAAQAQGIPCIEFQHGTFSRYHPFSLTQSAVPYREVIPTPHKILVFGEYWKQEVAANGYFTSEPRPVGSMRIDEFRKKKINQQRSDPHVTRLLFTSQGIDLDRVIPYLQEVLAISGSLPITLDIKLHPLYDKSKKPFEEAFGEDQRVRIISGAEAPSTMDLMIQSDFNLSIYSTCHYDALGLGLPTIILPFTGHEVVLHLYHSGHACFVHSPREILDIITNPDNKSVPPAVSEFYFTPNAFRNIIMEIKSDQILSSTEVVQ